MLCTHCGTKNKENAKYCKNCGQSLGIETQPTSLWRTRNIIFAFLLVVVLVMIAGIVYFAITGSELIGTVLFENKPETEWIFWKVPEGSTDRDTEQMIKEGLLDNKYLNPLSDEEKEKYIWSLSIESLNVEDNWAIMAAAPADKTSGELVNTEGIPLLGRKSNDQWIMAHPQEERFIEWLPLIPDSLISPETKDYLIMRYGGEE